jgi:hypothetical protein
MKRRIIRYYKGMPILLSTADISRRRLAKFLGLRLRDPRLDEIVELRHYPPHIGVPCVYSLMDIIEGYMYIGESGDGRNRLDQHNRDLRRWDTTGRGGGEHDQAPHDCVVDALRGVGRRWGI